MRKVIACIIAAVIATTATACSSGTADKTTSSSQVATSSSSVSGTLSSSETESAKINQQIKDTKKAWDKLVDSDLPSLAKKKDTKKMVTKLTDTIAWCDKESDYFLKAADSEGISDEQKQACLNMKTGLYGAESSCFEPMLKVFKGSSSEVPENYSDNLDTATDYIKKAYDAIK